MSVNPEETLEYRVPTPAELGVFVKKLRDKKKWSQATLAELAGIKERTVQRVENGEPSSFDTRRGLARAFECEDLDVFNKPHPFPNIEKLEKTTVAVPITRIKDARTLRTMMEGTECGVTEELKEVGEPFGAAMPRVEISCDGTARRGASLDAALDARAQGLNLLGRLRPVDLGLLPIAELDAAANLRRSEDIKTLLLVRRCGASAKGRVEAPHIIPRKSRRLMRAPGQERQIVRDAYSSIAWPNVRTKAAGSSAPSRRTHRQYRLQ